MVKMWNDLRLNLWRGKLLGFSNIPTSRGESGRSPIPKTLDLPKIGNSEAGVGSFV